MTSSNMPLFPEMKMDEEADNMKSICSTLGVQVNTPGWPDAFGEKLHQYIVSKNIPLIRTLSLFSGAGGLDIGFHDLGFEIVSSVEIENKFCETLEMNSGEGKYFPCSKVNCIDIRQFTGDDLENIDWIIGGPPCQTFSAAGRRASGVLGTSDARGVLFLEYVRLLKKLKPKGFLFENVYGIIGAQNGKPWKEIVKAFKEAGYILFYRILDAADYGVPQHRERLIIVGIQKGTFLFPRPTNGPDSMDEMPFYNAGTAIKGIPLTESESKTGINGRYGHLLNEIPPGLNYSFFTKEMGHPQPIFAWRSKFSDFLYKADPDAPVRTIKASGGQYTGPLSWENRYFSCQEYKRLQTFPDTYKISGTKQIAVKQIGNSVPPQLARMLALAIRIQIFNTKFPFKLATIPENFHLSFRRRKRELTKQYREKAQIALANEGKKASSCMHKKESFYLSIGERFEYIRSEENGDYKVNVRWTNEYLGIKICPSIAPDSPKFIRINIRPRTSWSLPISNIQLSALRTEDWHAITAAWKVLEQELMLNSLKADLTQLNGYYQSTSQIECQLITNVQNDANILSPILNGECTQRNIKTEDLAFIWNISKNDVLAKAIMLKKLGYEVRNIHTNPLMNEDEWLIPYKFPTLVPQSVQLYKKLQQQ